MTDAAAIADLDAALRPTGQQIQTDLLCEGCGYNLYTQAISRDERLGLRVCRCPECGRFAVPGKSTDAGRPWQRRLGAFGLILYILFLLYLFGLGVTGLWAIHYLHLDDVARPARLADEHRRRTGYVYVRGPNYETEFVPLVLSPAMGYAMGSFFAIFFAHWRRPAVLLTLAVPLLTAAAVHVAWSLTSNTHYAAVTRSARWASAIHPVLQAAGLLLGLLVARPITRGFLRLMLARSLLPYFSNLWIADGKTPPSAAIRPSAA